MPLAPSASGDTLGAYAGTYDSVVLEHEATAGTIADLLFIFPCK